ncbi:LOW QUALITY PROTEIN: histo-blood group ABO system transferase-like, partial [Ursus americanus]|uniref:LOW QUALITY PROTEIN: histo-blood group ABO system transferase-like n=1 Tax=Ursus americanus TaxID=9643 RepID=UPI001E67C60D
SRKDVLIMTPWLAPIIWEGTFNMDILNEQFRLQNATIGLTVFSVKAYMIFLKQFLKSAEMYFMVGHRVNYYVFTDKPEYVPHLNVRNGRQIIILKIQSYARWQDISMHRMEMLSTFSRQRFQREVDYLVCADVDMRLSDHVGVEVLSSLFGTLHLGLLWAQSGPTSPMNGGPQSQAHIPEDEGDFYYIGALFGGSVSEVSRLTEACHRAIMVDQANHIEAIWHDESHLNKYFLYHKPSKVLSPEYLWYQQQMSYVKDQNSTSPKVIKRKRFKVLRKNYRLRDWTAGLPLRNRVRPPGPGSRSRCPGSSALSLGSEYRGADPPSRQAAPRRARGGRMRGKWGAGPGDWGTQGSGEAAAGPVPGAGGGQGGRGTRTEPPRSTAVTAAARRPRGELRAQGADLREPLAAAAHPGGPHLGGRPGKSEPRDEQPGRLVSEAARGL